MECLVYGIKLMKRMSGTPSARPYIKVLSGCHVLVNVSPTALEQLRHLDTFEKTVNIQDLSDALVIGRKIPIQAENLLQLSAVGKDSLIRAGILPPVEQLKIVQGYSGLAIGASAIQGVGYMYGIVVRLVQGLHVCPLEAIAFMLNLIVLVKAMLHFYSSSCHRPLLLFLDPVEEAKVTAMWEAHGASLSLTTSENLMFSLLTAGGIAILPGGILMFFIVQITNDTSLTITIPLIIIRGGILLAVCIIPFLVFQEGEKVIYDILTVILVFFVSIINFVGYVYSIVVSVKYWESSGFNIRSSNYLAQILPYLG